MSLFNKLKEKHSLNVAVKEALDSLPSAICYFTPAGSIKLCNTSMYELYREITGKDLQNFYELNEAVESCGDGSLLKMDSNVYIFPDGKARQYTVNNIRTEDGRQYIETVLSDVTGLYEKRRKLEQQSEELKSMYGEISSLSDRLVEITREQEILNMKVRLHDQMNTGIMSIQQILRQNRPPEECNAAIDRFCSAIRIMNEDNTHMQDELSEFINDAKVAGVHVNLNGRLPEEDDLHHLVIEVLREACINAVRHADATVLDIEAELTEETSSVMITNNGNQPEEEIVPSGGLKDLGRRIERAGGRLEIQSVPELLIAVTLPLKRHDIIEERLL